MKNAAFNLSIFLFIGVIGYAQKDMTSDLYRTYERYKEPTLNERRIKHKDIQPLIAKVSKDTLLTVKRVGQSIQGRSISLISIGSGDTNVLLWSQMHGNEPTATQAIFDILNFFGSDDFGEEKKEILSKLTLHFLPMLNPDGAEVFQRRNALGIDVNRDAAMLQSPEGRVLKKIRDSLQADFGFNLHDQSTHYNAERTPKPATISYLAPAFNYEKDTNTVRANAMKVIVFMNRILQKYAPGQVGRYNDDFEPRAFGDNIQKWGTSTILIESGGYPDDVEKQEIRKLNYVSILSAIYTIAMGNFTEMPLEEYGKIPENDRKLFDLKIKGATYRLLGRDYILDLGIDRLEVDNKDHSNFYYSSRIIDQGDLSTYYGYETLDAQGYTLWPGKVYPYAIKSMKELAEVDINFLLRSGYTYIRMAKLPKNPEEANLPIHLLSMDYNVPDFHLQVGINPTFILAKDNKARYAVVNGFLIDLSTGKGNFKNGMIYR